MSQQPAKQSVAINTFPLVFRISLAFSIPILPWTCLRDHLGQTAAMATRIQLPATMMEETKFLGGLPPWTNDSVWQEAVASLVNFPPGVSVLELCAGAGTASIALKLLLGQDKAVLVGAWDISPDLAPIFRTAQWQPGQQGQPGPASGGGATS